MGLTALSYLVEGRPRDTAFRVLGLLSPLGIAVGFAVWERRILLVFACNGALLVAANAATYSVVYPDPALLRSSLLLGPVWILVVIVIAGVTFRRRAVAAARRLVAADQEAYDAVWDSLHRDADSDHRLSTAVDALAGGCSARQARQYSRRKLPDRKLGRSMWDADCGLLGDMSSSEWARDRLSAGDIDMGPPVDCLDQLFVQVKTVNCKTCFLP